MDTTHDYISELEAADPAEAADIALALAGELAELLETPDSPAAG